MQTLIRLIELYKKYDLHAYGGFFPWHFDRQHPLEQTGLHQSLPFMAVAYGQQTLSTGGGIAPLEVLFLSSLSKSLGAQKVFIVGNAFGWSTFALGFANPNAHIVAIDALVAGAHASTAFDINQQIIAQENFQHITLLLASSPNDVPRVVNQHLDGEIDLVLIDGKHTNEQQTLDFEAVVPFVGPRSVVLLHDVLNFNMAQSFNQLRKKYPQFHAEILIRTPSGMGVFYGRDVPDQTRQIIEAFTDSKEAILSRKRFTTNRIRVTQPSQGN